ncbi:MAG: glycosyltransferase [Fidelibacterota bacterium]|nr:MAG: glycosyltransferase [Candidatus Neomarinimicrobiota bacterium]
MATDVNHGRRYKVLFIPRWYPTADNPIHGIFVREQAQAVAEYDDVAVLYVLDPKLAGREHTGILDQLENGIRTVRGLYRRAFFLPITWMRYYWSIWRGFRYLIRQGFEPDVIHVHVFQAGVPAVVLGWIYRIPVVITEHYSGFLGPGLSYVKRIKARFAFNRARMILPVSNALGQALKQYGIRGEYRVIPNVLDTSLFYPLSAAPEPDTSKKQLLFAGSLLAVKGVPYLLRSLKLLDRDDYELHIIGDGPQRGEYEQMVLDLTLGERVTFHGRQPIEKLADHIRRSDFLVLPSICETFGVVLIEAMGCGKPVIATDCGGPRGIVTEQVGLLVSTQDEAALARGIEYMLDHHQEYQSAEIAELARERYSRAVIGEQIHKAYIDSIGTAHP